MLSEYHKWSAFASTLGDTATAILIDKLPTTQQGSASPDMAALNQQLMSFAIRAEAREIQFMSSLAEMKTSLAETRAELHLVKARVEYLEGQIIVLLGDRALVAT